MQTNVCIRELRAAMAESALCPAVEQVLSTGCRSAIKRIYWGFWREQGKLIGLQRWKLIGYEIFCSIGYLNTGSGFMERAFSAHLGNSYVPVPVGDIIAVRCRCCPLYAVQTKSRRYNVGTADAALIEPGVV